MSIYLYPQAFYRHIDILSTISVCILFYHRLPYRPRAPFAPAGPNSRPRSLPPAVHALAIRRQSIHPPAAHPREGRPGSNRDTWPPGWGPALRRSLPRARLILIRAGRNAQPGGGGADLYTCCMCAEPPPPAALRQEPPRGPGAVRPGAGLAQGAAAESRPRSGILPN